ncbi:MAG: hypothetical protein QOI95_2890 [Acidimicrobiaceae bacterium]
MYTPYAVDLTIDVQGWYAPQYQRWTYAYNSTGLRKSKTSPTGIATGFTWSQATGLPMLLSETTAATTTSYIYGPGGLPVEQLTSSGGTPTVMYLHHDQLGSTRLISDAAGTTLSTFTYDPYGKLSGSTGTVATPLGFAGQYTDPETGFQYLRARYYEPATGQFLTRDHIEAWTGDPYGYAANSPLSFAAPTRLARRSAAEFNGSNGFAGGAGGLAGPFVDGKRDLGSYVAGGAVGAGFGGFIKSAGLGGGFGALFGEAFAQATGRYFDAPALIGQGAAGWYTGVVAEEVLAILLPGGIVGIGGLAALVVAALVIAIVAPYIGRAVAALLGNIFCGIADAGSWLGGLIGDFGSWLSDLFDQPGPPGCTAEGRV